MEARGYLNAQSRYQYKNGIPRQNDKIVQEILIKCDGDKMYRQTPRCKFVLTKYRLNCRQ